MLIAALGLSGLFILVGVIGVHNSTSFGSLGWVWIFLWPGFAGSALAVLGAGAKWIPVIKVVSPVLAWLSLAATLSVVSYLIGTYLLDLVWK